MIDTSSQTTNDEEIAKAEMDMLIYGTAAYHKDDDGTIKHIPIAEVYKTPKELALDYLKGMGVEPNADAIVSWVLNSFRNGSEDDYYCVKYGRRMIRALVTICGGNQDEA
ncbi:unnamed protein product [Sphagnum jensenii]|uniref:Uncharacterized protein n=1 Tax=Sphagnum jensenii TaxID=128206 RepID=A0ABP0V5Z8_9BRYO